MTQRPDNVRLVVRNQLVGSDLLVPLSDFKSLEQIHMPDPTSIDGRGALVVLKREDVSTWLEAAKFYHPTIQGELHYVLEIILLSEGAAGWVHSIQRFLVRP